MTQKAFVRYTSGSLTVPSDWPGFFDAIHCFGGGQAGAPSTIGASGTVPGTVGAGGAGGDWSVVNHVTASVGNVFTFSIGTGGLNNHAGGGDTWVNNPGGTKIVQARGAASAGANIGDNSNPGGAGLPATVASYDGSYGNVMTPGFGGIGGSSAGGPPDTLPGATGVGSRGGDTNTTVGQLGGTGGGCPCAKGTPPWDAPGQAWMAAGGDGFNSGDGGGRNGPPYGFGKQKGYNCPEGHIDGVGAGGGFSGTPTGCGTQGRGGHGLTLGLWFDWQTSAVGGPGAGGGGGGAGYSDTAHVGFGNPIPGTNGGNGGRGGGGGASAGTNAGPAGAAELGNTSHWLQFTGTLGVEGAGGDGMVVFLYTPPDDSGGGDGGGPPPTGRNWVARVGPIWV